MTVGAQDQAVVKVRIRVAGGGTQVVRNVWTSPVMPRGEAIAHRAGLVRQIVDIGDAAGFVEFTTREGRPMSIRAREVVTVELCSAPRPDPVVPAAAPATATGGVVAGLSVQMQGAAAGDGTSFLRHVAGVGRQS